MQTIVALVFHQRLEEGYTAEDTTHSGHEKWRNKVSTDKETSFPSALLVMKDTILAAWGEGVSNSLNHLCTR